MSKKRPPSKPAFDIPPVPQATRFVTNQTASSYLDSWIPDLISSDFEEVQLPPESSGTSRLFKNDQNRQAIHLLDSLYIPGVNRTSATGLTALQEGVFFTVHLAIASPATLKIGSQNLKQSAPYETINETQQLLGKLIRLQSPQYILEAFQHEQVFIDALMSGEIWGRSLFSALLWSTKPPLELLTDWQGERMLETNPDGGHEGAARLFIGLFASRSLRTSFPALANFAEQVIPTGLTVSQQDRLSWSMRVFQEWIPLYIAETDTSPARSELEVTRASEWLAFLLDRIEASSRQGAAAAGR